MQIKLCFSVDSKERAEDVALQIERVGREACKTNKKKLTWAGKWNSLHFIREGRGVLKLGDKEMRLKEGMCFILYEGIHYEYYQDTKKLIM